MSQHDYNVANQTGANTRADLNTLFQAIAENNSGATEPATKFAFQWWADTATDILKQRNAANTAWISVMKMSTGVVLQKDTTDGIAGLTALKINFKNVANTFTSFFTNTNTAARTYTFPNKDMTVAGLDDTTVASTKLPQITITAATGAITVAGVAKYLDFRSATLTSGTPSTVLADPADLVIPSGATLGVTTTLSGRIVVVEMNNAGTAEYAVINIAGGIVIDEMGVISTTAISTASDSNNVWYSTTARTSLPYRVVACFDAVNTAGAWSSPTLVQPAGGNALTVMGSFGYGQTWQDLTGSRTLNTTLYTNNTWKPIFIKIDASASPNLSFYVQGVEIFIISSTSSQFFVPVPVGATYGTTATVSNTLIRWAELR